MNYVTSSDNRAIRRTDALSRERIVQAAVTILDSEGENALTFRTLAVHLSTGPGAIYWHIANKDELLSSATNAVLDAVIGRSQGDGDPRDAIRALALGLFDAFDEHPWVGSQMSRETWREAATCIFEAFGGLLNALGVPGDAQFDAASVITNYVSGVAGQNAANARRIPAGLDRHEFLTQTTSRWASLDPTEYPFVHRVLAQLPEHDDREQFGAGIEFILRGLPGQRSGT